MGETVLLALLIIAAVWAMALVLVASLCAFAKRGDEALAAATPRTARRLRAVPRLRGARACDAPLGAVRR